MEITRAPVGKNPTADITIPLSWDALDHEVEKVFTYKLVELTGKGGDPVSEIEGGYKDDQVIYDASVHRVRVTLAGDPLTYKMSAKLEYEQADGSWNDDVKTHPVFENIYVTEPVPFTLKIDKQINGKPAHRGRYSFTLYDAATDEPVQDKIVLDASQLDGKTLEEVINVPLGEGITKPTDAAKVYNYYLKEDVPAEENRVAGMTYDVSRIDVTVSVKLDELTYRLVPTVTYGAKKAGTAVVNNLYEAEGDDELSVRKKLEGRSFSDDDSFTLELTPVAGAPLVSVKGGRTQAKISQVVGKEAAVADFGKLYYTVADLTDANGVIDAREFEYLLHEVVPDEASVMPEGAEKSLLYKDATSEERALYDGQWTLNGLIYAKDQTITVSVADNGNGTLSVNCQNGGDVEVVNVYKPTPAVVENLRVTKQILDKDGNPLETWKIEGEEGMDWTEKEFTFTLESVERGAPLPESKGMTVTVGHDLRTGAFGPITFTQKGTYHYTIEEELPWGQKYDTVGHLTYDQRHSVSIVVEDDEKGNLTAKLFNDAGQEDEPQTFKNKVLMENGKITVKKRWVMDERELENPGDSISSISVYLYRSSEARKTPVKIGYDTATMQPVEGEPSEPITLERNDKWEWEISGLPNYEIVDDEMIVYSYYVQEVPVEGWQIANYTDGIGLPVNGEIGWSFFPLQDGGSVTITNSCHSASLPATGGPGTSPFTGLGTLMTVLAAVLLIARKRNG